MRKWIGWVLLLSILFAGMIVWLVPKKIFRNLYLYIKSEKFEERKTEPIVATFDWNSKELKFNKDSFQYVNFRISDSPTKIPAVIKELNTSRPVFITVDMWNDFISENPLESIVKGKYDEKIRELCGYFLKNDQVFIRWNPEMEVPANKYPWQGQSPLLYNEAFKYFSTFCRTLLPQAKIVWSTAGYPGVLEYFPGDELIDYVSVTLQSASEKSTKAFPAYKTVAGEVERKIHRLRFIKKPVIVIGAGHHEVSPSLENQVEVAGRNIRQNATVMYGSVQSLSIQKVDIDNTKTLKLGVVDPHQKLNQEKEISVEHVFLDWSGLEDGTFRKTFNEVIARKHDVIVTLEPWREKSGEPDSNVLVSTLNGRYDSQITEIYDIISNAGQTVYFRFAHEMEIPVTRYAWQSKSPVDYIKAFRYVATFKKPRAPNIKIVWGPAGDRGLQDWWPGDDVVDYISMAIYGLPDKNVTDYTKQESFETIYRRKIYRMRFFNKPVFITEFGIKGPEQFQLEWLLSASKVINANAQIAGVCYFNMVDTPKAWGDIEAPDWSISQPNFREFIKSLNLGRRTVVIASQ